MTTLEAILSEASGHSKLQTEFVKSVAPSFSMTNFAAQFSDYQRMQAAEVQSWQSVMAPSRALQKIQTQLASSSTAPGHLGHIGADLASAGVPAQVAAPIAKLADQVAEMQRARVAHVDSIRSLGVEPAMFRSLSDRLAQSAEPPDSWMRIADDLSAVVNRSFKSAADVKATLDGAAKLSLMPTIAQAVNLQALGAQASTLQMLHAQVVQSLIPRAPTRVDARPEGMRFAEPGEAVTLPRPGQEVLPTKCESPGMPIEVVMPVIAALVLSVVLYLAWQTLADTAIRGTETTWLLIQLVGAADSTSGGHGVFLILAFALPHFIRGPQRPESD